MPVSGLAKAKITEMTQATGNKETSRSRFGGISKPAVDSPKNP